MITGWINPSLNVVALVSAPITDISVDICGCHTQETWYALGMCLHFKPGICVMTHRSRNCLNLSTVMVMCPFLAKPLSDALWQEAGYRKSRQFSSSRIFRQMGVVSKGAFWRLAGNCVMSSSSRSWRSNCVIFWAVQSRDYVALFGVWFWL